MYQINEIDVWRQHRKDLLCEAEGEHLVRRLEATRPHWAARLQNALLGRGPALVEAAGESRCA